MLEMLAHLLLADLIWRDEIVRAAAAEVPDVKGDLERSYCHEVWTVSQANDHVNCPHSNQANILVEHEQSSVAVADHGRTQAFLPHR